MKYVGLAIFAVWILPRSIFAQGTLPDISVRELTQGKVQISWVNPHGENCIQISIQRSSDSTKNFRTIFSSLSPELPSNGFVDNKPLRGISSYYRIFYVLQGGAYYFSKAGSVYVPWANPVSNSAAGRTVDVSAKNMTHIIVKGMHVFTFSKAEYERFRDSINKQTTDALRRVNANTVEWKPMAMKGERKFVSVYNKETLVARMTEAEYRKFRDSVSKTKDSLYVIDPFRVQLRPYIKKPDFISVYRNDSLVRQLQIAHYKKFRDSVASGTRDTIFVINPYRLEIHPFVPRYVWRPSQYVFTNAKGYVSIVVPLARQHRYRIVFFEGETPSGAELFEIRSLKEPELVLDKTNFMHAGWFSFELYENEKLKEKNKFFLPKEM